VRLAHIEELLDDAAAQRLDSTQDVVVVLSHHPLDWLNEDEQNYLSVWMRANADLHLRGHVHEANSESVTLGSGEQLVTLTAGAVHAERDIGGTQTPHGYNVASLLLGDNATLSVRVWPSLGLSCDAELI
jgi:3',5'-cyclic AMP phosphodiesterase CpdA